MTRMMMRATSARQWSARAARRCVVGLAIAAAGVTGQTWAGLLLAPDPNWQELEEVPLPALVNEASLRPIVVDGASRNRFYVDEDSVSVGEDGVVRYVLVVRAAGGAENVSFEGLRCATGQWRLYAMPDAEGAWQAVKGGHWKNVGNRAFNRPRAALAYDYFCDGPAAPRDRKHALKLLRSPRDAANREGVR